MNPIRGFVKQSQCPLKGGFFAYGFYRVLFTRTTDLVQKLQQARRDLALESAIAKLDKFDLLILDDFAYVTKDQAETSVLFELISARYERRSMLITANQPFGACDTIFPDPSMTMAAQIDWFTMRLSSR
ncbi:ATP-binding protein [Octadecabacter antarcticus]|uniref:ATP-binding protein n=1 Tax=Octadecabacter antarcticus TaxID=1217908 RepID=UPI0023B78346|nr:ATP-binding protein [Octadecabacter antarcticus]